VPRTIGLLWLSCVAACGPNPTTLLLELEGSPSLTSLDLTIAVEKVGTTSRQIALTRPLPATVIVELPAEVLSVTLDVVGHGSGPTLTAHAVVSAKPHQQVTVPLDLEVAQSDGGSDAAPAADLERAIDLGHGDLKVTTPVPRLISTSYFSDSSGPTFASPSPMTQAHYFVDATGVVDGDLLIVVGNIDNGGNSLFPNPFASGFTQLAQQYFGSDGQTYFAAWKIASSEPASYSGNYGSGNGSGSAVLSLIAVSGANKTTPINTFLDSHGSTGASPTVAASAGVTTTVPGCALLYAAGADWLNSSGGSTTFGLPTGYSSLMQTGDHGNSSFDWTSQMVGWTSQANAGASGSISGTFGGTVDGIPWSVVIAVAP
jgi:hypothetical protein